MSWNDCPLCGKQLSCSTNFDDLDFLISPQKVFCQELHYFVVFHVVAVHHAINSEPKMETAMLAEFMKLNDIIVSRNHKGTFNDNKIKLSDSILSIEEIKRIIELKAFW